MDLNDLSRKAHKFACDKGFWPTWSPAQPEMCEARAIGLIHSEVSELMEAHRQEIGDPEEHKQRMAEEMADIIIRVADLAGGFDIDLEQAVDDKMRYNASRPWKHGKRY